MEEPGRSSNTTPKAEWPQNTPGSLNGNRTKDSLNSLEGEKRNGSSAGFLFVFLLSLLLAERETLEPGVGAGSDWLPAPLAECLAGRVSPASMADTVLSGLNLLARPLRGSGHQHKGGVGRRVSQTHRKSAPG